MITHKTDRAFLVFLGWHRLPMDILFLLFGFHIFFRQQRKLKPLKSNTQDVKRKTSKNQMQRARHKQNQELRRMIIGACQFGMQLSGIVSSLFVRDRTKITTGTTISLAITTTSLTKRFDLFLLDFLGKRGSAVFYPFSSI